MIVTLDAKRRLTVPAALVPTTPGEQFDAEYDADDHVILLRRVPPKKDWFDVLLECPVPMDDLPPRSRDLPRKLDL